MSDEEKKQDGEQVPPEPVSEKPTRTRKPAASKAGGEDKAEKPSAKKPAQKAEAGESEKKAPARKPRAAAKAQQDTSEDAPAQEPESADAEAPAKKPTARKASAKAESSASQTEDQTEASTEIAEPASEAQPKAKSDSGRPSAPTSRRVVRARARYVRTSARKARMVCVHLRGRSVHEARAILAFTPRDVARDWSKLLESAVANAENNHELLEDDLVVHEAYADEGPTIKRFQPRAQGRATPIRKRTSHLTITLTTEQ